MQTIVHRYFDSVVVEGVLGGHHMMGLGPELGDYRKGELEVGPEVHHIAVAVDFVVDFVVGFVDFVVKILDLTVEHHLVLEHEHDNEHRQKHY